MLLVKGRGVSEERVSESSGEEVSDDEADHESDETGGDYRGKQRLSTVDVARCFDC